ncbi:MAG TPA: D-alanine--D-alanine ligase [Rhodospirillaceae bacterium]|nr:MAG: hypothetical protein A2018_07900 [Alphaproteobacteria bacterium GWF2_58_20]HAU30005.1 D-alanine--D-alanine ligase [Rhodospirillaceae bacterium]
MSKNIAVLMGGWSGEREVSLMSGKAVSEALRGLGHTVREIDPPHDATALVAALSEPRPDLVFNALHGAFGEDGHIQSILDLMHLPYTHSGVMASAIGMDKPLCNKALASAGVPVPESFIATADAIRAGRVMDPPYVIKPLEGGSSIGIHLILGRADDPRLDALELDETMMVERYIPGRELTVAVMGRARVDSRTMTITELQPHKGFYDYEHKYSSGKTTHVIPADLPPAVMTEVLRLALLAHDTLGCSGISRSDFRYDDSIGYIRGIYFLEINTQPGMTPFSLVPEQAAYLGMSFPELVSFLVENPA